VVLIFKHPFFCVKEKNKIKAKEEEGQFKQKIPFPGKYMMPYQI
jgi:hypothetical protein